MKFIIPRAALATALSAALRYISSCPILPILSHVRLQVEDDQLALRATDLDDWIEQRLPCTEAGAGAVCVPAHLLLRISRAIDATEIHAHLDAKDNLHLQAGNSYYQLRTLPAEDFPVMPDGQKLRAGELGEELRVERGGVERPERSASTLNSFSFTQSELAGLIDATHFATSTDPTRQILHGIYLDREQDGKLRAPELKVEKTEVCITAVATDGRRMALLEKLRVGELRVETGATASGSQLPPSQLSTQSGVILPSSAVHALKSMLGTEGDVTLAFSDRWVRIQFTTAEGVPVELINRMIDGAFPNYRQIIPDHAGPGIKLSRAHLSHALRSVAFVAESCHLTFENRTLMVTASVKGGDECKETIFLDEPAPVFSVHLNSHYLLEGLEAASQDHLRMLHGDQSPLIFTAPETHWRYIIMPMR